MPHGYRYLNGPAAARPRLMGVQLVATYLLIALLYICVPNLLPNTNIG